ncbi:thiamine pyrophosphate-dependent enzyme [Lentzea indica]|uniref:thiamine pyrophosphate-dependent enzyme n=1 Tax=Lentzea indica TaxID=2604800 RepID=UPI001CB6BCAE|nr:thiamine pyrophosphate-dependent enzyme [Lentzea indica]
MHLLAAMSHTDSLVLAQVLVDTKVNETKRSAALLDQLDLKRTSPDLRGAAPDMIDLECEPPRGVLQPARILSDETSLEQLVAQICAELENAENPMIWVGVEIDRLGLQQQTLRLIQRLNVPFVTELMSKAVLPEDHPLFVGALDGQASSTPVMDLARASDFILVLGVWLTDINSLGWEPDFDKTAFASLDAVKFGTYFGGQVALEHLIGGILAKPLTPRVWNLPEKPAHSTPTVSPVDGITYQGVYDFIQRYVDEKTIIGSDPSMNYFGSLLLDVPSPGRFVGQSSYSSIGYIAPAATGICLAKKSDQRVMVFSGDGGFQMTTQCLSTQTRFGLDPIIFVINNGVYGVEQWLADSTVFHTDKPFYTSCTLHPWNYSKLSGVFGCQGWMAGTGTPSVLAAVPPDPAQHAQSAHWSDRLSCGRDPAERPACRGSSSGRPARTGPAPSAP